MKRIAAFYLGALLICGSTQLSFGSEGWAGRVYEAKSRKLVSSSELVLTLSTFNQIVLGEKHNTEAVQLAQAQWIRSVVSARGAQGGFATAWEFLNAADQERITTQFDLFKKGSLDVVQLLVALQGNSHATSYAPILEVTRALGGSLVGVNLSREQKAPVVKGGLQGALPGTIPSGFAMGSAAYYERFASTMEGHATPEQMKNYYEAQCLTDDVIATHFLYDIQPPLRFLVEGSFHTDYLDGTVARLKARESARLTAVLRFVDAADFGAEELEIGLPHLLIDPKYGPIADWVIFVNEPTESSTESSNDPQNK